MSDVPPIVEIAAAQLEMLLEAGASLLPPDLARVLHVLVDAYRGLLDRMSEPETTIAELRRLYGLRFRNSEKTKDVLAGHDVGENGNQASASASAGPAPASATATTTPDAAVARTETAPPGPAQATPTSPDVAAGTTEPVRLAPATEEQKNEKKPPHGHGRLSWKEYPNAECIPVLHESLRPGHTCPLCGKGKLYDTKRPAPILRIIGQAPLVAKCWFCEALRCSTCGHVFTAEPPPEAKGPKFTETAAAMIMLERYGTGLPHHRQERLQEDLRTPVPASTGWGVVRDAAKELQPVLDELRRQAAQAKVLYVDDSYVRILAFMGKRLAKLLNDGGVPNPDRTGLFTTAITAVTKAERLITIFVSGRRHAGENLDVLLKLRDRTLDPPLLMSDALNRNVPKNHEVVEANCLQHGRRHLVEEIEKFPKECAYLLLKIGRLYRIDGLCAHFKLSADQRLRVHQKWSHPIMDELHTWMTAQIEGKRIEPNSGMGKAVNYLLKRWTKFTVFLRRPGAPIDNNISERSLKMAIQLRNNSLFYRNEQGASVGDLCMSLIHTARHHGANSYEYLTALLVHAKWVAENPADWLPWN
ncbi:MAG: transposase, IS66 family, partial [bacterium]